MVAEIFVSSTMSRPAVIATQLPVGMVSGTFFWDECPRLEADHAPPSSAEFKKTRIIHPLPPYVFLA
jgi:hypothetical protein